MFRRIYTTIRERITRERVMRSLIVFFFKKLLVNQLVNDKNFDNNKISGANVKITYGSLQTI